MKQSMFRSNAANGLISGLLVFLTACSVGDSPSSSNDAQSTLASCRVKKAVVDPSLLKIKGEAITGPGEQVRYSLNEDLSCSEKQSVNWKVVSSPAQETTGPVYVSSFKAAGEYVVAADISTSGSNDAQVSYKTVVTPGLAINGPILGMMELEHHFEISFPMGTRITGTTWNMGDGSPEARSAGQIDHTYYRAGDYTVTATVSLADGNTSVVTHKIRVLEYVDGMECVRDLALSGPSEVTVGQATSMSIFIPACMTWRVRSIRWDFADGSPIGSSQSVQHTYTAAGTFNLAVSLFSSEQTVPFLVINREIVVTAGPIVPEDPPPVNPKACSVLGAKRDIVGELMSREEACGVNGKKIVSYRRTVTEECKLVGDARLWSEVASSEQVLDAGTCQGQSCELPSGALEGVSAITDGIELIDGKYYIRDGAAKNFHSTTLPNGSCQDVREQRTCSNGVLGGSSAHVYLLCQNGCANVGPHGSTVTVVSGEESVAKACTYGETGVFDIFNQLTDKTCDNGQVNSSNIRRGNVKTAGLCPVYSYAGTENWTACSAACGGDQAKIFECRDDKGNSAPLDRCKGEVPVAKRVCDANPESVRRSESATVIEDAGASKACPANQIGEILSKREVTTTKVYACINHQVGLESTNVVNGPWITENLCKKYVSHRCNHDSLNNEESQARLQWMQTCRAKVPVIDKFLNDFEDNIKTNSKGQTGLVNDGRFVYATFMNKSTNPEKMWAAPRKKSTDCNVPSTVYIAAVCVASCATPEQPILAQQNAKGKLSYVAFVDAWDQKFNFVATLQSNSKLSSKVVQKTAVDNWVTELVDSEHDIVEFTMASGRQLRLTPNHPLVTEDGRMRQAGEFKVGQNLVMLGGVADQIVQAKAIKYIGKVYNVFVKSAELHKNIVVTNGYLNGTAFYQNEGSEYLNRRLLRGHLIRGVLNK